MTARIATTVAVAALVSLAACRRRIDTARGEREIRDFFEARLGPVERVHCPTRVDADPGGTFVCTIAFARSPELTVIVTQKPGARFAFDLAETVVSTSAIQREIAAWVRECTGADAVIDCGAGVQPIPDGGYRCSAVLPDGGRKSVVVVAGPGGKLTWKMAD